MELIFTAEGSSYKLVFVSDGDMRTAFVRGRTPAENSLTTNGSFSVQREKLQSWDYENLTYEQRLEILEKYRSCCKNPDGYLTSKDLTRIFMMKIEALRKLIRFAGPISKDAPIYQDADTLSRLEAVLEDDSSHVANRMAAASFLLSLFPERKDLREKKEREKRSSASVKEWRRKVLSRDGYECQRCGSGKRLHVHHIIPWSRSVVKRVNVSNGVTLCEVCHKEHHFGSGILA